MESSTWANIFQKEILTDHSTIKYFEDEYRTPNSDVSNENNIILESRTIGAETFVLPSRAYLVCKAKVVKNADGTDFTALDNISLLNGWQSFSKVELYMNGSLVDLVDYPGYVDTMIGLLEDQRDYDAKGSLEYRYFDTANGSAANEAQIGFAPVTVAGDVGSAAAIATRFDLFASYIDNIRLRNQAQFDRVARSSLGASYFWFKLPLNHVLGLCKVDKPLRGIQMQLRLTKETNNSKLLLKGTLSDGTVAPADGKLVISKISLMMPCAKPHIDVFKDLNDRLRASEPIPLDYQRIWCNIYPSQTSGVIANRLLSNARRPRHVFLALQDNARHAGQTRNSLAFDIPTTSIVGHVRVGNQAFPAYDYNSSNDGWVRFYNAFLDAAGKNLDRSSNSFLTFDRWKNVYPIMYFDCSANDNQFELQQDAEIVCNLTATGGAFLADYSLIAIVVSDENKLIRESGAAIIIESTQN